MTNQQKKIRVGLIGCGNIGARAHAPVYAQIPEAHLVAVCDQISSSAADLAAGTGADQYQDYHKLLARDDIDMIDLCVPTFQHAPIVIDALNAGKNVLSEKPMAMNLSEADAMIECAHKNKVKLMIGHVRRFDNRYIAIKNAIKAGNIGRLVYIRHAERQHLPFPSESWFWNTKFSGGLILDIGIHIADLFHWYIGQVPVSVYAVGHKVREVARKTNSFDHAFITFNFPDKVVGLAEASWTHPPNFGGGLYASQDVIGTGGKVQYSDKDSNPMLVIDKETDVSFPRYFRFMSTTEYAFKAEIQHFVHVILDDLPFIDNLNNSRTALKMALAAKRSAELKQPVSISLEENSK
jgi:predicted dehydrogenase